MLINLCKSFHMSDNPSLPKLVLIWDAQFRPLYVKILSASCFNILYICLINLLSSILKKNFYQFLIMCICLTNFMDSQPSSP